MMMMMMMMMINGYLSLSRLTYYLFEYRKFSILVFLVLTSTSTFTLISRLQNYRVGLVGSRLIFVLDRSLGFAENKDLLGLLSYTSERQ